MLMFTALLATCNAYYVFTKSSLFLPLLVYTILCFDLVGTLDVLCHFFAPLVAAPVSPALQGRCLGSA